MIKKSMTLILTLFLCGCSATSTGNTVDVASSEKSDATQATSGETVATDEKPKEVRDFTIYYYNEKGEISQVTENYYDKKTGLRSSSVITHPNRSYEPERKSITEYEYDEDGNLIKEEQYNDDKLNGITTYEYDTDDKLVERCHFAAEGYMTQMYKYDYDGKDEKTGIAYNRRETVFDVNNSGTTLYRGYVLEYDGGRKQYDKNDILIIETISEYGDDGEYIGYNRIQYDSSGKVNYSDHVRYEYEKDADGNTLGSKEYDKEGNLKSYSEYVYK